MPTVGHIKMHPRMVMDIINRQAGTLGKAILEGVMNAVDAGASRCNITLDERHLIIDDNGKGFMDNSEAETIFAVLGHDPEEGQKTFGTFHMGRGQLWKFGYNVWRSNKNKMVVDIKHKGTEYVYSRLKQSSPGCTIDVTLYEELSLVGLRDAVREVEQYVKWVGMHDIVVVLNGKQVSHDPREAEWDYESERCWIKTKQSGGMGVYNIGVLVRDYSSDKFGIGGTAISRQQLRVNFARNDVMSDCPVWREMTRFINEAAGKETEKHASLDDMGRRRIALQLLNSEVSLWEISDKKIFTDVAGRHWSYNQLRKQARLYGGKFSACTDGSRVGDKIHQSKLAFIMGLSTAKRFDLESGEELAEALLEWDASDPVFDRYIAFEELSKDFKSKYTVIPEKEWTLHEKACVQLSRAKHHWFCNKLETEPRRIMIGISGQADGWTDGSTYIAINRHWIERIDLGTVQGCVELGALLLHEYCHDDDDKDTHIHGADFYQRYHDAGDGLAAFVHEAIGHVPRIYEYLGRDITKKQAKEQDRLRKAAKQTEATESIAART